MQWLEKNAKMFDCILLDPPSFSNSKRMENIIALQSDVDSYLSDKFSAHFPAATLSAPYRAVRGQPETMIFSKDLNKLLLVPVKTTSSSIGSQVPTQAWTEFTAKYDAEPSPRR